MKKLKHNLKRFLSFLYPPRKHKDELLILTYHSINTTHPFSIKPEEFEKQIKYLVQNFEIVDLNELDFNKTFKKYIAITFDDGYEDNFIFAFPILRKYKLPATIFLTSDFILNNLNIAQGWGFYEGLKPLTLNQIKNMIGCDFSFGVHGKTHKRLSTLNQEELVQEIEISKNEIEKALEKKISAFAYPFGQRGDFNEECINLLKRSNYRIALSNIWGINETNNSNLFFLKRIEINYLDNYNDFLNKINGRWNFIGFFQKIKHLL